MAYVLYLLLVGGDLRVVPISLLYGQIVPFKMTWIIAHDGFPLRLRHRIFTQIKVFDVNAVDGFFPRGTIPKCIAHVKATALDRNYEVGEGVGGFSFAFFGKSVQFGPCLDSV